MGDLDFSPVFKQLREQLAALGGDPVSVDKPTFRSQIEPSKTKNTFYGWLRESAELLSLGCRPIPYRKWIKHDLNYRKSILEVLKHMPIKNPKTGEMDHVDLSLVSKIIIEPEYLHSFTGNEKKKVEFKLIGFPEQERLTYEAHFHDDIRHGYGFELAHFEKIMSEVVHSDTQKRLEQTDDFIAATNALINWYIDSKKKENELYARLEEIYMLDKGIGMIHDLKVKQDVSTFETFKFCLKKNTNESYFNVLDIISNVRTLRDYLEDPTRYQFTYYSLSDGLLYTFTVLEEGRKIETLPAASGSHGDQSLNIHHVEMTIKPLELDSDRLDLIVKANDTKELMRNVSPDDFLAAQYTEQFKTARFNILKASEEKAKKEQMLSKYADLEF